MPRKIILLAIVLSLASTSFAFTDDGKPVEDPAVILKSFNNFLSYYGDNIELESNFVSLDESSHQINKDAYLRSLISGNYLPLRLSSKTTQPVYRLYKMDPKVHAQISECVRGWAADYYRMFLKIGTSFPTFQFTDLNGQTFNSENTHGKILVLKGWSLSCPPCIKEIPQLNMLVAKYKDRKDIIFVSTVPEAESKVRAFLTTHPFSYSVVARQNFILNNLQLSFTPCHIIVNKNGMITCITSSSDALADALAKEANQ